MEELKAIFSTIPFWFYEKYKLRGVQGKVNPSNSSNNTRNNEIYTKLEKRLTPILNAKGYTRKKKRIYIRINADSISYINLALNNKRNGICIDYDNISNEKIKADEKNGFDSIDINNTFKRLRPSFWNYDYQYPVRKSDSYDQLIIDEIEQLLNDTIN